MKIISVILARGGSKGIPKKNMVELQDTPLLTYTLKASLNSKVSETWVSTDCEEIAKYSRDLGSISLKIYLQVKMHYYTLGIM